MTAALATCVLATFACKSRPPRPALQVLGESTRVRSDEIPAASPYFDGTRVTVTAAVGETIGLQIWHTASGPVKLTVDGAHIAGFDVESYRVERPSTKLYGGSHGKGEYPDGLVAAPAPTSDPAYFTITAQHSGTGELVVGDTRVPVELKVYPVHMPPLPLSVWAYYDASELGGTNAAPNDAERACIAMFRAHGVLLSPDLPASAWPARKELLAGATFVPATISSDPAHAGDDVRAWIAATDGSGQVPFAIPIDEPHKPEARAKVRALADAARAAGSGPGKFLFAVTDERRPEYGDVVDLPISLRARRGDWTYNGAPPRAGAMVLDAESPGLRTWGWIAWRWQVPIWYVWDALYWHDRHNKKAAAQLLDATRDAVSFDDGDDHGNLDGVLAMPGCKPTLRLEALRRGLEERALIEEAAACSPGETAQMVEHLIPRALGDAPDGSPASWPSDDAVWETAHKSLLAIAAHCAAGQSPR